MTRGLRLFVLFAAIFATLAVASASATPAHLHPNAPASGCELCFVAHTVTYEAGSAMPAAPLPLVYEHALDYRDISGYQSAAQCSALTRGPPSCHSDCVSSAA